jgi:Flp pilus assembly protein TadD
LTTYPEKTNYQLHVAICQVQLEQYEEALKVLYRLNYEQPENDSVNRVLAWTLTCQGKLEQAEKIYGQLTQSEQQQTEDLKNYGYCLWLQGQIERAATVFQQYVKGGNVTQKTPFFDEEWLQKRGVSATEIKMMESLLFA